MKAPEELLGSRRVRRSVLLLLLELVKGPICMVSYLVRCRLRHRLRLLAGAGCHGDGQDPSHETQQNGSPITGHSLIMLHRLFPHFSLEARQCPLNPRLRGYLPLASPLQDTSYSLDRPGTKSTHFLQAKT